MLKFVINKAFDSPSHQYWDSDRLPPSLLKKKKLCLGVWMMILACMKEITPCCKTISQGMVLDKLSFG